MEQSQSIKSLAKALLAFQVKIEAIKKDSVNPHFRNRYASLTSILEAIKDPLSDCGLVITQWPCDNNGLITTLIHADSGEFMRQVYFMAPERNSPHGQGSALTYMRRYCTQSILNLCFEDDDDANAASVPADKGIEKSGSEPTQWLNEGTELFDKAVEKLKSGATTIPKIRLAFKVSKKVEAALNAAANPIK